MRSRLNLALVVIAGAFALVLTVIRQAPDGGIETASAHADPKSPGGGGGAQSIAPRHDLSALSIFNKTLLRIKERYVDPSRIDPKKMLFAALDSVQYNIPEVLVEPDAARNKVAVAVNDKREVFDTDDVDSPWRLAAKLKRIFRFIETNMNAGADLAKVEYAAVNGMLSTLDPHSILMDPEQARDMDVSTSGKFGGLGIVIRMIERKLTVIKPMRDTPAWRAGIKAGDIIVRINNENTENLTSNEAVDRMRGDPRTGITLWVQRKGTDANAPLLRFDLQRDVIRVSQVDHKLLDKGVGYIKVKQFSKGIASDVADAMKEMTAKGASSWILDLRGNPGGLLEEAVQLGDLFVDSGTLVTTVSGRDREARRAERGGETNQSLAVLVSPGSASASEIVAGALKNLDRAAIIGARSFGKGSVQELYDNDDHSKLKLTIAQYLTPGDRSIQNLGIVPDIALQRMYVPDKNDAPGDYIRMLAPTRSYGEKDLDAHLTSTYAKDTDKPAFELSYMVERKKPTAGQQPVAKPADDDDDPPDDDEIVEDFEIRFAKDLVSSTVAPNRNKLVAKAQSLVGRVRGEEEKKLVSALSTLGVDWSAPTSSAEIANLDASLATQLTCRPVAGAAEGTCANVPNASATSFKAGDVITVTATVKNSGPGTAYRVHPRLHADDNTFEDTELPIGKINPGETKTFTTKIKIAEDAYDRVDHVNMEMRDAKHSTAHISPAEVRIEAAPRPVFAYAYQLVDDSNGDGLVQRGEKYRLLVSVKNTGPGPTQEANVLLRNMSGDGVTLVKSRFEIKDGIAPGQVREIEFPITTDATMKADELVVELMAYDGKLDVTSSEKIHFKVSGAVQGKPASGDVSTRSPIAIRSGAADDTGIIGMAQRGQSYATIGQYGAFTKVKLSGNRVGFIPSAALASVGGASGAYAQTWNSIPPTIALATKTLETHAESYKLAGTVTDEQHVEDVYVFVSNQVSKIESRKVFYRSNRGGKDGKALEFSTEVPLWPGSNMVTVVARANSEVRSVKTMFVYRDPPRTAQATTPNSP